MTTMNGFGDLPLTLTPEETAQLLRKSRKRKAVYLMADRGQIPGAVTDLKSEQRDTTRRIRTSS